MHNEYKTKTHPAKAWVPVMDNMVFFMDCSLLRCYPFLQMANKEKCI